MKKPAKKIDVKKITGLTTLGVSVLSLGILFATGWFIVKSLNDVAVAKTSDQNKSLKIQGVNNQQLEKVLKFVTDKESADRSLAKDIKNPYAKPAPAPTPPAPAPAPAVPSQPAPAPTPAP